MKRPIQTQNQTSSVLLQKDRNPNGNGTVLTGKVGEDMVERKKVEDDIYNSIVYQLEVKKIYLDPELSLVKFSSIVGTNTTYLSNTVNRRFGVNLKTLVNRFRVGHAKGLMKEFGVHTDLGELIRLCGFSSRSIFYAAFRREVGMTPTRYLAKLVWDTNER